MNTIELITKKRDGEALTSEEMEFLITRYVNGDIPDYQISAFLMAVYFQGMTSEETAALTRIMRDSGVVLTHPEITAFKVDKHSTGGVGDKVSLILAPLLASVGLVVPMISGRALAHTGGTLDKLESIPGFRTDLNLSELNRQLQKIGVALVGQTANLCPADKKIYALRDATATVNAIPLITASILSKKMAEGIDALVLDVKAGSGAIFKEKEKAWELARMLVSTADGFDLKASAIITSMLQPLGNAVGNWLETREAVECLRGKGPHDLVQITLVLGAQLLVHSQFVNEMAEGMAILEEKRLNGEAFDTFRQIVQMQGGDVSVIENPDNYPNAVFSHEIKSPVSGYVAAIHSREIGRISMLLGAGRSDMSTAVDYTSGIMLNKKVGDSIAEGEILATAYSNNIERLKSNQQRLEQAFEVQKEQPAPEPLIYSLIDATGEKRWNAAACSFEIKT
ncbi:MAG: thymidine phosphorylase [bacterium]